MLIQARSGRDFLREELARRIGNNARYSLRAFARHLGLSPGELSEILSGKRRLSAKAVLRISRALSLSPPESRHLLCIAQLDGDSPGSPGGGPSGYEDAALEEDAFRLVADWYALAILSLADCRDFRGDPGWVAQRLAISRTEAEVALERLRRLGLLKKRGNRLVSASGLTTSPNGVPSEAVRHYHRQILGKAAQAIDTQNIEERELGGACFAANPADLPALKRDIAAFWKDLVARYARPRGGSEVYQMELALFRLTTPLPTANSQSRKKG